ncbi:hypothetical protein, partial [Burkholderia pseudomallei]|uniref:hypothetical protein n=1 Tax=Burkholderia pseudomallei TaxID=28450 RepID=UPI0015E15DBF
MNASFGSECARFGSPDSTPTGREPALARWLTYAPTLVQLAVCGRLSQRGESCYHRVAVLRVLSRRQSYVGG